MMYPAKDVKINIDFLERTQIPWTVFMKFTNEFTRHTIQR